MRRLSHLRENYAEKGEQEGSDIEPCVPSKKKKKKKPRLDEVSSSQKYNVSYLRDIPYENRIQLSAARRIKKKIVFVSVL